MIKMPKRNSKIKTFVCPHCGATDHRSDNFKRHLETHTGNQVVCACGDVVAKTSFRRHQKRACKLNTANEQKEHAKQEETKQPAKTPIEVISEDDEGMSVVVSMNLKLSHLADGNIGIVNMTPIRINNYILDLVATPIVDGIYLLCVSFQLRFIFYDLIAFIIFIEMATTPPVPEDSASVTTTTDGKTYLNLK